MYAGQYADLAPDGAYLVLCASVGADLAVDYLIPYDFLSKVVEYHVYIAGGIGILLCEVLDDLLLYLPAASVVDDLHHRLHVNGLFIHHNAGMGVHCNLDALLPNLAELVIHIAALQHHHRVALPAFLVNRYHLGRYTAGGGEGHCDPIHLLTYFQLKGVCSGYLTHHVPVQA